VEKENLDRMTQSNEEPVAPRQPEAELQSGEKVFHIVLFLLGLFAFSQAFALWQQIPQPRESSAAALPLFVSGVWTLLALAGIISNIKKSSPLDKITAWKGKLWPGLQYALPKDTLVTLGAILVYCALLMFKVSFYIATPLFLYGTMCYLCKKGYVKNIIWTGLVMAFIIVVFRILFGVVFP